MKLILSALLAAAACFLWGYFSWTVLGWHQNAVHGFHDEEKLTEMIKKSALAGHGTYVLPFNQEPLKIATADEKLEMAEAYQKAYTDGPYLRAVVRPGKREVKMSTQMIQSFLRSFVAALMLGGLLSITIIPYLARVLVCAGLGLFASLVAEVPLWIWFESPGRDLVVNMVDHVIEWAVGGLVLGAFLGKDPTAAQDRN